MTVRKAGQRLCIHEDLAKPLIILAGFQHFGLASKRVDQSFSRCRSIDCRRKVETILPLVNLIDAPPTREVLIPGTVGIKNHKNPVRLGCTWSNRAPPG